MRFEEPWRRRVDGGGGGGGGSPLKKGQNKCKGFKSNTPDTDSHRFLYFLCLFPRVFLTFL